MIRSLAVFLLVLLTTGRALAIDTPAAPAAGKAGEALWQQRCSQCHDHPADRIPPHSFLSVVKTPEQVVQALTTGIMQSQAAGLKPEEIKQLATYLTGRAPGASSEPDPKANMCKSSGPIEFRKGDWRSWGHDLENSRDQPDAGITAADVPRLKVKWVFAYPGSIADGQPTVYGNRIFVTSRAGRVFSLDAKTGCTYWYFDAEGGVRTAVNVDKLPDGATAKYAAYFATENGWLHAVDAETGKPLWKLRVEDHPVTRLTGAITLYKHRLYVPLASLEEMSVRNPSYNCCTFRGGVAAIDATNGKLVWKTHTVPEPKPIGKTATGVPMYGPAGVAIFSAPTVDEKRHLLYVGTGNSYTQVSVGTSNAIIAFDLDTGAIRWVRQVMKDDNICPSAMANGSCEHTGPDFDFAAPPILRHLANGKDILVAGSKAEIAYGFDPDDRGKIVWQMKLGEGNRTSGVWGLAADDSHAYMGSADVKPAPGVEVGGLTKLDIPTGKIVWHVKAPPAVCAWGNTSGDLAKTFNAVSCSSAQPGALALVPGAVFSGSMDGHIRALSTKDGSIIWDFDTAAHPFDAVNGAKARGGSISYGAQTIANGMVYVISGAGGVHQPGNALIAFSVDGK